MNRLFAVIILAIAGSIIMPGILVASEQTVILDMEKMNCSLCPITIRKALEAVEGVNEVEVSFKEKKAFVKFDDEKTNILALTTATTNGGLAPKAVEDAMLRPTRRVGAK